MITWITALCNSMKLWVILYRAIQDEQVILESSNKRWSTAEGNGKLLQYSALRIPQTVWKCKKIWYNIILVSSIKDNDSIFSYVILLLNYLQDNDYIYLCHIIHPSCFYILHILLVYINPIPLFFPSPLSNPHWYLYL